MKTVKTIFGIVSLLSLHAHAMELKELEDGTYAFINQQDIQQNSEPLVWQVMNVYCKNNQSADIPNFLITKALNEVQPSPYQLHAHIEKRHGKKWLFARKPEMPDLSEKSKKLSGIPAYLPDHVSERIQIAWLHAAQAYTKKNDPEFKQRRRCVRIWACAMYLTPGTAIVGVCSGLVGWSFSSDSATGNNGTMPNVTGPYLNYTNPNMTSSFLNYTN